MPALRRSPTAAALALAAALPAVAAVAPRLAHAQQVDVIRGRVTGPDNQPVENVQVTVTSVSGNVNRAARTDRNGRFTITFPNGDGDYFVAYQALGFAPRRVQLRRVADEDFLLADIRLQQVAEKLDAVRVTAPRDRVNRNEANSDVGVARATDPSVLTPDQMGDLAAMAGATPGVTPVPGADGDPAGFSVLGLSADQNQTTLNGMPLGGSNLPRDAAVMGGLVTSPYDVSTGGFSGARFNFRPRAGTNFVARTASLSGTAPALQWTDRAATALGQQTTDGALSGMLSGPLKYDQAFYNVSYQLGRTANDLQSLLNTDPVGLQAAGLAADSVARLTSILRQQGVPLTVGGVPSNRFSDRGSLFATFDVTPRSSQSGQSLSLVLTGGWNRQQPAGMQAAELPAHAGTRTGWNGGAQLRHSSYVRNVLLSETTLNWNRQRNAGDPYVALPNGSVLVASTFDDGTSGVRSVSFGGNPWLRTWQASSSLGGMNQLSWFSRDNKHRLKLATELRYDTFEQDATTNLLGTYAYNSLADLQAGRPALFTRQLAPRVRDGGMWMAAASLGDSWRKSSRLQLQYGVRLDAHRFTDAPTANPLVASTFGVRNDVAPARLYASPRLGFSWNYGTGPQIGGFAGAMRGPRAVVRGGVGVFQNVPQATLLGAAQDNTGLATAVQQLACAGAAIPTPAWSTWAGDPSTIPAACLDGTTGPQFGARAPNVALLARDWQAPRSVRGNLAWSGAVLRNRLTLDADASYSLNLHQASTVDLNFGGAERFALTAEGGRPVYVAPTEIVPATGAIAAGAGRRDAGFLRVSEQRSDLRSTSHQLQVGVRPVAFNTRWGWSATYTWQDVREQTRGFLSTAGDPRGIEWARGAFNTRHQLFYSLSYNAFDAVRISWNGFVRSGLPFTPQIAGDVNGDGWTGNDRAFVFDPAATGVGAADPSVRAGMQALLASGSPEARACLSSQLGRLAGRSSCEGPWTHTGNLSLSFNPVKVRMPQRATLFLTISNPLGGVDRLLHGENGLKGWGQTPFVDPNLLYVRGFDPATNRYRYEVNQRFADTRPRATAFRAPVGVTLMVRTDLGPTRERQFLVQQLDRGRRRAGDRTPEPLLRAMYANGGLPNPLAQILRQADTLRLTGPQADSIATMNRRLTVRMDSIWAPLAKAFAALPDDYDRDAAYARYRDARRASVDLLLHYATPTRTLLTAEQRRKLPTLVASHLDPRYLAAVRSGTAGASTGGLPMFGGMMPMGGGGGGGMQTVIIR